MNGNLNSSNSNNSLAKNFIINYQNAFNNYSIAVNYYIENKGIITKFEKTISEYKSIIKDFQNKLLQLKTNFANLFNINESNSQKFEKDIYPLIKAYFDNLNNIFMSQIDIFGNQINDLENKIICKSNDTKNDSEFLNILKKNRDNLQNEEKKMEKLIIDYENEHKILMISLEDAEENIKKFIIKKEENKTDNIFIDMDIFDEAISDALNKENIFDNIYSNFINNNINYFDIYEQYLEELKNNISRNYNYLNNSINLIKSSLINNYKKVYGNILGENLNMNNENEFLGQDNNIEKKTNENKEDNNSDFKLFEKKYFKNIEKKFIKENYKVRVISDNNYENKIKYESKQIINDLSKEFGIDNLFEEVSIIPTDEDIFNIVKIFFETFKFVDKSVYNLKVEEDKINFKNLLKKIFYFYYGKKKDNEMPKMKPIIDEDIETITTKLKTKDYILIFLQELNQFRTKIFELPQKEYEIISKYLNIVGNFILEVNEKDNYMTSLFIILPQTFYTIKNGKKNYLTNELKRHKIFQNKEFWKEYIINVIEIEFKKIKSKSDNKNQIMINKNMDNAAFLNILPFCKNMMEFGMDKKILLEIIDYLYNQYNISEQNKKIIDELISK